MFHTKVVRFQQMHQSAVLISSGAQV